ncbi:MAG: DUF4384 domain-containing protein [Candidatus Zixiibacteriota bacterium]
MIETMTALAAVLLLAALPVYAQQDRDDDDSDRDNRRDNNYTRIDRYLDVDVWSNHSDDQFYEGDNIVLSYRVNRDAFVAIYSIDSRGRVRLLFPNDPNQDNYIRGGVTYQLPSGNDNYDLEVDGPAGTENIQILASRERFPIPDWYDHSGLVADVDSRDDYMDYLNSSYFVKYNGQRFSYDRLAIDISEWEQDYFRPVYHPIYPGWAVCGNAYIDYAWGSSVYINGVYWGCTPLYVPWILAGWHTVTIYDPWGRCWEDDIHVSRYNTVVLNKIEIHPSPAVVSKFKEVRAVGFKDPVSNGYPKFKEVVAKERGSVVATRPGSGNGIGKGNNYADDNIPDNLPKKYVRGDSRLVKTDRGLETETVAPRPGTGSGYERKGVRTTRTESGTTRTYGGRKSSGESNPNNGNTGAVAPSTTRSGDDYYQRKSGHTEKTETRSGTTTTAPAKKTEGSGNSGSTQPSTPSNRGNGEGKREGGNKGHVDSGSKSPSQPSGQQSGSKPPRTEPGGKGKR